MNKKARWIVLILVIIGIIAAVVIIKKGQEDNINGTYTGVYQNNGVPAYCKAFLNNGNIELHMGFVDGDDDYVAFGTYTVSDNIVTVKWDTSGNIGTLTIDSANHNLITSTGIIMRKTA